MSASRGAMNALRAVGASGSKSHVSLRFASSALRMPAMSPTMTEGGIAGWKKQEGEAFSAGDVLLEIETDKATIDVEAQDDGVMGKILTEAGQSKIPVGQIIAMLAEEGDDLSAIEVPKELGPEGSASASSSEAPKEEKKEAKAEESKAPEAKSEPKQDAAGESSGHGHKVIKHSKPLFPSVSRLLLESDLSSEQISKLKGTGKGGMLTKGDVLLAVGKIKNAYGSAEKLNLDIMGPSGKRKSEASATSSGSAEAPAKKEAPLDGPALRRLILAGLSKATQPSKPIISHEANPLPLSSDAEFDAILAPYASLLPPPQPKQALPTLDVLQGGKPAAKDDFAGLW